MLVRSVAAILDRDLQTLSREVEAYPDGRQLWQTVPGMTNTGGTLVLHLAGNLRHYIGAKLGGTGYVRDRAVEFSRRDVSRRDLLEEIEITRAEVARTLARLDDRSLPAEYPEIVGDSRLDTQEYLIHLLTHFAYHLGQLDIHRRIVTGDASSVGAVKSGELGSARPARS
jgi:uncharacterized damage-inducible protein DinB